MVVTKHTIIFYDSMPFTKMEAKKFGDDLEKLYNIVYTWWSTKDTSTCGDISEDKKRETALAIIVELQRYVKV